MDLMYIPFNLYILKYLNFFDAIALKSSINTMALLKLSYDINKGNTKLIKINNFFAVKNKNRNVFNKYATIFEGINAGLDIIKNNPDYTKYKLGTLKANENLQYLKMKNLLKL